MDIRTKKKPGIFGSLNPVKIQIREGVLQSSIRYISSILLLSKPQTIKLTILLIKMRTLKLLKLNKARNILILYKCT